jgi:hypothetical protein
MTTVRILIAQAPTMWLGRRQLRFASDSIFRFDHVVKFQ